MDMELYGTSQFYVLGRLLFGAGVYGVELKQLTKILYGICYVLCSCELWRQVQW